MSNKDVQNSVGQSMRKHSVKYDKPVSLATAFIDETSDLGSRTHGKRYLVGASVVDSDKIEEFRDIAEKRQDGKELKFRKNATMRNDILDEVSELEPRLYAITVTKPRSKKWSRGEQLKVHRNALCKLIDRIVIKEDAQDIHVIADHNDRAKEDIVRNMASEAGKRHNKNVTADVCDSRDEPALQTNDFVIGAMGKKYNHRDGRYIKRLNTRIDRSRIIVNRTKSKKQK